MTSGNQRGVRDHPLTYLPRKPLRTFGKGQVIYDQQQPNGYLYVVILGRVRVIATAEDGGQTVCRLVCPEGIFGESCLVGGSARSESAIALDDTGLMAWSRADIEQQIEREPKLGIALSQYLVRECIELQDRIESMALHQTPERVMVALLQLAEDLGTPMQNGSMRLRWLTHQTIAEYVGTSREIVTFEMNRLRRLGLLDYTRKHMDIYTGVLQQALQAAGVSVPLLSTAGASPSVSSIPRASDEAAQDAGPTQD
jgi:CRP/FNR family transcriptional regulator, cyclic AMP receptor protein